MNDSDAPVSVNYFPFYPSKPRSGTDPSRFILPIEDAKRGLRRLQKAGMRRLNIAGDELFFHPRFLAELLRCAKQELHLKSVSVTSNGLGIREGFLLKHRTHLASLTIACDSFVAATNQASGRGPGPTQLSRIARWCHQYGILLKLNTVVNVHNWDEDMAGHVARLAPIRWTVCPCLVVEGEHEDETRFRITDEQWQAFGARHRHLPYYVAEDRQAPAGSCLLLDERLRFMDKGDGAMNYSDTILEVDVIAAMQQARWDREAFAHSEGIYQWSRPDTDGPKSGRRRVNKKALDW